MTSAVASGMGAARVSPAVDAGSSRGWVSKLREDDAAAGATGVATPLCAEIAAAAMTCSTTTASRNDDLLHAASTRQVERLLRQHGEVETPMSHQSPRVIKAAGG